MRILIVAEYPSLNGGERSLLAALAEPVWGGVEIGFLVPRPGDFPDAITSSGRTLLPLVTHRPDGVRTSRDERETQIAREAESFGVDVIHGNSLMMSRFLGRMSERLAVPVTGHLRDIMSLSGKVAADLNRCWSLACVSGAVRTHAIEQGVDAGRLTVLHNGIDADAFTASSATDDPLAVRSELGLPADAKLLLFVGQIGLRKDVAALVEMFARVRTRHPLAHLLIVGERHSQKEESVRYAADLRTRSEQPDLMGHVHWLGRRSDVPRLMRAATLLVHPARQEPFGRVLLEAAASGLPIVCTAVGGSREMLGSSEAAAFVPPADVESLTHAVSTLLSDEQRRQRMSAAAASRVRETFTARRSAEQLRAFWQSASKRT